MAGVQDKTARNNSQNRPPAANVSSFFAAITGFLVTRIWYQYKHPDHFNRHILQRSLGKKAKLRTLTLSSRLSSLIP
jgi:hypothetical protein